MPTFGIATGRGSMCRILKLLKFLVAIPLLGGLGLSGWLAFVRPELLPLASAYAAKAVCSNVFIAKRDADAVIRTDVQFAEHRIVKLMKIDVDTANRRVEAALFGLFGKRYAAYAEGRGCTLVSKDEDRQCRSDRNGDQGRQAFAGLEGFVSAMGRGRSRGYLRGRLDGHVQRFGIQRGQGPPQRRRAYGILGERCGGFCEGQSARRSARDDISLWVRIVRPVGADLAERDRSGCVGFSTGAVVQAFGHDQRGTRI
jgi:hypothetical protein